VGDLPVDTLAATLAAGQRRARSYVTVAAAIETLH
jgi:hypothetical protein